MQASKIISELYFLFYPIDIMPELALDLSEEELNEECYDFFKKTVFDISSDDTHRYMWNVVRDARDKMVDNDVPEELIMKNTYDKNYWVDLYNKPSVDLPEMGYTLTDLLISRGLLTHATMYTDSRPTKLGLLYLEVMDNQFGN